VDPEDFVMSTGLFEEATQFIEEWEPLKKYHFEAKYLDDLKAQLTRKFKPDKAYYAAIKKSSITIEDGEGLDIAIRKKAGTEEEKVGIIFKKDLQQLDELKRLMAQIEKEGEQFNNILVVLYGNTDGEIREKLNSFLNGRQRKAAVTIISR
jgi:UDP-N-acetyl-D-mannosaminuronic acid transferase (WecB/TagA/CpsF family)